MSLTKRENLHTGIFFCIVACAFFVRFAGLNFLPLGVRNDEIQYVVEGFKLYETGNLQPFITQNRESTLPIFYGFLVSNFGYSVALTRYVSAAFGCLLYLSILNLLRRRVSPFTLMCTALFLLAYLPFLYFSRINFRIIPAAAIFFIAMNIFEVARKRNTTLTWLLAGIVYGLGFHTYHTYRYSLVLVILAVGYYIYQKKCSNRFLILAFPFGALLTSAHMIVWVLLKGGTKFFDREVRHFRLPSQVSFSEIVTGWNDFIRFHDPFYAVFPMLIFVIVGLWKLKVSSRERVFFSIFCLFGMLFFLLPGLCSELLLRRVFMAIPFAVILAALGFDSLLGKPQRKTAGVVIFLLLLLQVYQLRHYVLLYSKPFSLHFLSDHITVARELAKKYHPGKRVFVASSVPDPYMLLPYLLGKYPLNVIQRDFVVLPAERSHLEADLLCPSESSNFYILAVKVSGADRDHSLGECKIVYHFASPFSSFPLSWGTTLTEFVPLS